MRGARWPYEMRWSRNGGKTLSSSRRYRSRQSGGVPRLKEFRKLCMNIVNVGAGGNILKGSYNGGGRGTRDSGFKKPFRHVQTLR